MADSLLNIMVVGTSEAIVMIESGAKEVKEETVVDAIEFAHTEIKKICAAINELRAKVGKKKRSRHPAGVRRGLLQRPGKESRRALDRRAQHREASESESYELVRAIKKELVAALPEGRRKSQSRSLKNTTKPCASDIFRDR